MFDFKINKSLLPMKGFYFLWNAGTAPIVPFMSIYARQLGFSSVTIGVIYTVLPFSGMLAKPLMGGVADRYKCQKVIFLVAQMIAAVAFLGIIFLPEAPTSSNIQFKCDNTEVAMATCTNADNCAVELLRDDVSNDEVSCRLNCPLTPNHWETVCGHWRNGSNCLSVGESLSFTADVPINLTEQRGDCLYFMVKAVTFEDGQTAHPYCPDLHQIVTDCDIQCDSYVINDIVTQPAEDNHVSGQYQFWLLLSVYLISWIGQAVTVSVGDAICFQALEDKPHKYGYQRMYGALGWGIIAILAGFLVDVFSKGATKKNYTPVFSMGVAIIVVGVAVSYQIRYKQQYDSASILKDVGRLVTNIPILVFMLWCICVGVCTALMWNFLFWLLEDLAASHGCDMVANIKTIEGLVQGIQCLGGELPFFFLSSRILKRFKHVHVMSFILFVIGLRMMFYSILTNPWWCLPIEFLNGLTFGLFYATMASYASIVAPPGTEATTQGFVGGTFEGIGVSLGSFVGGILFQDYGGSMTFRIFGIFALVACLLHICVQYFVQRSSRQTKEG